MHLDRYILLTTLGNNFSRRHIEIYFVFKFSQKTGFDIICKLSPMKTIGMKCQILFSEKKKVINLSSVELAQGVVKVKGSIFLKNRHFFFIQESFNELIYSIHIIIKCGI